MGLSFSDALWVFLPACGLVVSLGQRFFCSFLAVPFAAGSVAMVQDPPFIGPTCGALFLRPWALHSSIIIHVVSAFAFTLEPPPFLVVPSTMLVEKCSFPPVLLDPQRCLFILFFAYCDLSFFLPCGAVKTCHYQTAPTVSQNFFPVARPPRLSFLFGLPFFFLGCLLVSFHYYKLLIYVSLILKFPHTPMFPPFLVPPSDCLAFSVWGSFTLLF